MLAWLELDKGYGVRIGWSAHEKYPPEQLIFVILFSILAYPVVSPLIVCISLLKSPSVYTSGPPFALDPLAHFQLFLGFC